MSAAATDEDIGYNAIIHYTITGEPYLFHVGELSGNITVLQPLDYESHSQYTFILKAFNPGEPYMQDTANITGSSGLPEKISLREYFSMCNDETKRQPSVVMQCAELSENM